MNAKRQAADLSAPIPGVGCGTRLPIFANRVIVAAMGGSRE